MSYFSSEYWGAQYFDADYFPGGGIEPVRVFRAEAEMVYSASQHEAKGHNAGDEAVIAFQNQEAVAQ